MKRRVCLLFFNLTFLLLVTGLRPNRAWAQPVNDLFANRTVITGTNIVINTSNLGASSEMGEPLHAGVRGGASLWWTWTAPMTGTATFQTYSNSVDTLMGIYAGSSLLTLVELASNDDDPDVDTTASKVVLDVVAGRAYQIAVDGYNGDTGIISLRVTVGPTVPPPPSPAWTLPDQKGTPFSTTSLKGKVVLMNFWATWCGPCRAEMPDIVALQEKYGADGLVVIGADVSWSQETAADVISFLGVFTPRINYQIVMSDSATDKAYGGISAIPTSFIVDRGNIIRKKLVGSQSKATFERAIVPLLYADTRLGFGNSGKNLVLSWPINAATYVVESSTQLNAVAWAPWTGTRSQANGMNSVVIPQGESRFFRLRLVY